MVHIDSRVLRVTTGRHLYVNFIELSELFPNGSQTKTFRIHPLLHTNYSYFYLHSVQHTIRPFGYSRSCDARQCQSPMLKRCALFLALRQTRARYDQIDLLPEWQRRSSLDYRLIGDLIYASFSNPNAWNGC